MRAPQSAKRQEARQAKRQARGVERLYPRLRRLFADGCFMTPGEVCQRLPRENARDVRHALRALAERGELARIVGSDAALYVRAEVAP